VGWLKLESGNGVAEKIGSGNKVLIIAKRKMFETRSQKTPATERKQIRICFLMTTLDIRVSAASLFDGVLRAKGRIGYLPYVDSFRN